MSINICDICKEYEFSSCPDILSFNVGLTPATEYYLWLVDKNDHSYNVYIVSDGLGNLTFPASDFTDLGLNFNSYGGVFEFSVSTSPTENTLETLTIDGADYPCINVTFFELN